MGRQPAPSGRPVRWVQEHEFNHLRPVDRDWVLFHLQLAGVRVLRPPRGPGGVTRGLTMAQAAANLQRALGGVAPDPDPV